MIRVFMVNLGSPLENSQISKLLLICNINYRSHWIFDDSGLIPDQYQDSQWADQQVDR